MEATAQAISLMKQLAIRLGCQPKNFWPGTRKTTAKSLVIMPRPRKAALVRMGDTMQRHCRATLVLQWFVEVFFTTLVVVPAFLLLLVLSGLAYLKRTPAAKVR